MMKPMNEKETTDEIIQETRRIKEALAKSMDFDIEWNVSARCRSFIGENADG